MKPAPAESERTAAGKPWPTQGEPPSLVAAMRIHLSASSSTKVASSHMPLGLETPALAAYSSALQVGTHQVEQARNSLLRTMLAASFPDLIGPVNENRTSGEPRIKSTGKFRNNAPLYVPFLQKQIFRAFVPRWAPGARERVVQMPGTQGGEISERIPISRVVTMRGRTQASYNTVAPPWHYTSCFPAGLAASAKAPSQH